MYDTLRVLGMLCVVGAGFCIVLTPFEGTGLLALVPGLAVVGIVFLALAAILHHVTRIEVLLTAGKNVITTNLGDFEKLGNFEGEATCVGCRRTILKAGLYYHKALDVYYHPECLTRDRGL
jgi:hypothetical protein